MKLNNIGYLLKEGFKGIFTHGFMSFAAVCVTVACLVIVGSFSILAYNLDEMVEDLNKTSEILVYVDSDLSDAEARSIGTKINTLDNILQATFVSREEALEDFIADHDGDSAFSGVQASDLRHRYVVSLEDNLLMKQTDEQLKQLPGVAKTNAAYELAEGFSTIQDVLHMVSMAVIAVLLVVTQSYGKKGIMGKLMGIGGSLYSNITGYFSDILSYSRLMALMLAGGVVGQVFNTIAAMPAEGSGANFVTVTVFFLIFIIRFQHGFGSLFYNLFFIIRCFLFSHKINKREIGQHHY